MLRSSSTPTLSALLLLGAALHGCGAKTGLAVPDVATQAPGDVTDVPDVPSVLCIEPVPGSPGLSVNLVTRPQLSVADVFFLIDRTGSMDGEIDNIKNNLSSAIVPQIAAAISDVQFGVATYGDFPLPPYGDRADIPFTLVSPIDRSVANVQGAVNGIAAAGGGDNPEAMIEALYQVATGAGYPPWISMRSPCAAPNRAGYACFRANALPIVILIADAPPHNGYSAGPVARNPYETADFTSPVACPVSIPMCRAATGPHSYAEAIGALMGINARVIGVNSGTASLSGLADMAQIARETSTVTAAGAPLVISIRTDGSDLDSRVVAAVQTFTRQVRFNATARVIDLDAQRPASRYVRAVRPVSADPAGSVVRTDATTFYGVIPGTRLTFALDFSPDLPRTRETQRIRARVQFLGDGRANLGFEDIVIVIPGIEETCLPDGDGGVTMDASAD